MRVSRISECECNVYYSSGTECSLKVVKVDKQFKKLGVRNVEYICRKAMEYKKWERDSLVTRPGYFLVVAAAPLGVAGLVFIGTI